MLDNQVGVATNSYASTSYRTSVSSGLGQNVSYHAMIAGLVEYALKRELQGIYMKILRNCNSNLIVVLRVPEIKRTGAR